MGPGKDEGRRENVGCVGSTKTPLQPRGIQYDTGTGKRSGVDRGDGLAT